jgi:ABC-2 type transport system permease protein
VSNALILKKISLYFLILKLSAREARSGVAGLIVSGGQISLRLAIYSGMYRIALGPNSVEYSKGIWAIAIAQVIFTGERPQLSLTIGNEIKDGRVSILLLRPIKYINQVFISYIGRSVPIYLAVSIFSFMTALFLTKDFPFSIVDLGFVLLVILSGIALSVLIEVVIGMTGFWTSDTSGMQLFNQKSILLFGGIIIPFSLLPETLANIVRFTPWSIAVAQPGYLATHFTYTNFGVIFVSQLLWLSFFYFLCTILYSRGIKRLSVGGG